VLQQFTLLINRLVEVNILGSFPERYWTTFPNTLSSEVNSREVMFAFLKNKKAWFGKRATPTIAFPRKD
jgi:hypothetical protein